MARTPPQSLEFNSFVKGLVTEASPLTYPEDASLSEENFVLNKDGSRQRRLGMDYETDYVIVDSGEDLSTSSLAISSFAWDNVASRGDLSFTGVQLGNDLYFYKSSDGTISDKPVNSGNPITLTGDSTVVISSASLYGRLIVVNQTQNIHVLEYDEDNDYIATFTRSLRCRDLWGVQQEIDPYARLDGSVALPLAVRYNLHNQGWPTKFNTRIFPTVTQQDPIGGYKTVTGQWPATSDMFQFGLDGNNGNWFDPEFTENFTAGTVEPPKGATIVDPFNLGQSRLDFWEYEKKENISAGNYYITGTYNITQNESAFNLSDGTGFGTLTPFGTMVKLYGSEGIGDELVQGGISSVSAYGGRLFYTVNITGVEGQTSKSPNLGTVVFYSQVGDSIDSLGKCYSFNDPTAKDFNQPLDTDGGFVTIPEAGRIFKTEPMGNSLFVFASGGVWEIHGGESTFSATNQSLSKTSSVGAVNRDAVISAEGTLAYWADGGIYAIGQNEVTLRGTATDITQTTIQSFYDAISEASKERAVGIYDSNSRQLRWLYRSSTLDSVYFYDTELIYDLNLQAFYVNKIKSLDSRSPYVAGYVDVKGAIYNDVNDDVYADTDQVFVNLDEVIVTSRSINETVRGSTKYLTFRQNSGDSNYSYTFSNYKEPDFYDWKTADGTGKDAAAFMLTGYLTGGDSQRYKQSTYITTQMRRTETGFTDDGSGNLTPISPSSCLCQAQWEWTNDDGAGRWGSAFQIYRLPRNYTPTGSGDDLSDYGFTVVTAKSKLRGKGRALSLKFYTEEGKDCHLYGWGLNITANQSV